ncbi:hypothetical protein Tsubulata_030538 [Turnera subulata]|uniref:Alpha/beta hydrolase fold-3 domain-containing protein n=1 Tax=Turnera subulata TaxID=218843 RepID=A0A9Q0JFN1_9ROSI|nr:hypothetical protein Tsubulata_030538 [Turnera subulata]
MSEIAQELLPMLRVYNDGRVERLLGTHVVPPGDPKGMVQSRDVVYAPEANLSSRLYLPKNINPDQKLPLLLYIHGGGFCVETAFSSTYHNYLNTLVAQANVLAVSVDYRTAPEHPLPIAYDDSWTATKWVASHVDGNGPDEWLNSHADFGKVFIAGDSSGANISHQMGLRHAQEKLSGFNVEGIVLVHPFFWGTQRIGCEAQQKKERIELIEGLWYLANPTTSGFDDPLFNPVLDPKYASLGCSRLLVLVAEKDPLRDRGYYYCEQLVRRGWKGRQLEIMEAKNETHTFHLLFPDADNAKSMLRRIAFFLKQELLLAKI